ncbi:hypothetical protein [Lactobacillus acetotolerans]|uniref:hypothetical protein n=1 Tax=Lactobacillus acetotolerans TaxID=1600 RepID=UPI000A8FABE2|nr:hypothetical protein [Lactobacillus acetotolerans]QGV04697.1 hypothetical protein GJR85_04355 [Lactobacillus acetotolerans]
MRSYDKTNFIFDDKEKNIQSYDKKTKNNLNNYVKKEILSNKSLKNVLRKLAAE